MLSISIVYSKINYKKLEVFFMSQNLNEDILKQLSEIQKQLQNSNIKTTENKKRKKGSYEMLANGKARLYFMLDRVKYTETIDASSPEVAERKLALFVDKIEKQQYCNTNLTYAEFCQIWMDKHVRANCSESVAPKYLFYLNNRILPYLGTYKLKNLNSNLLLDYFNMAKDFKTEYKDRKENSPISKGTYLKLYEIISGSLQKAFEWDYLPTNPCRKIPAKTLNLNKLPSERAKLSSKSKIRAYNLSTYKSVINLLNNANTSKYDPNRAKKILVETALKTGFCREELAGLKWERDFNYKNSTLSVNSVRIYVKGSGWIEKEPKVSSRRRTIKIPSSLNELLNTYHKETSNNENIFFNTVNFISITSWFKKWQEKNHITPVLTLHELRHTHPTILLKTGAKIKDVSMRLGHSNINITLQTYTEYLEDDDDMIADILDNI